MTVQTFPKALSTRRLLYRDVLCQVPLWSVHRAPQLDCTTQSTSTVWIISAQRAPACRNMPWMTEHKNNTCSLQPEPLFCPPEAPRGASTHENTRNQLCSTSISSQYWQAHWNFWILKLKNVNNPLKESSVLREPGRSQCSVSGIWHADLCPGTQEPS